MSNNAIIGWDVGGAHLKVAYIDKAGQLQSVKQYPCPLWQGLDYLHNAITEALTTLPYTPQSTLHSVTMTGELVDLFPDRATGVRELIRALAQHLEEPNLFFFGGTGGLLTAEQAMQHTEAVASANWLATGLLVGQNLEQGLLIDIGSTTTDLLLIKQATINHRGYSDFERMQAGELVYTGVVRTPLMAITDKVPFFGAWQPLMAEYFATTADIYRLVGELDETLDQMPTADGQGKTSLDSARRLARMLGVDVSIADLGKWQTVATYLINCQARRIMDAIDVQLSRQLLPPQAPFIGAGAGNFVVRQLATWYKRPFIDFAELIQINDPALHRLVTLCAPAVAVAYLARIWNDYCSR
ncbi:putative H4MPT-linked C1 transfer pathway protein [Beggiatoa alba B18LD]|uniref:Putative H4MPT-linked C1 transfer pathway protein n=1 Tax=Beggiatoa alba B18LD TaxID=395493 RepID=I3CI14_9GAMM|nr:hydantoinase/oxoprolinase family protein [Beggiatoa alba]EIJ43257.1 putative H4MPT-linked C1 transfer pathway protein [Beggiatoa alba B18LD]